MLENILFVGAWVFLVIGVLSIIIGIVLQSDYNGSVEESLDAFRGVQKSYRHITKFGFWSVLISLIIITANYI